jgi:hypothetical protein
MGTLRLPQGPLPLYDLEVVSFDHRAVLAWTLEALEALGVVGPLENLHERVGAGEIPRLVHELTERSMCPAARFAFGEALKRALPKLHWPALRVQAVLQYRILLPDDEVAPAAAHSDHGLGHSLVERNVWVPLTPARGSAALRALPLRASLPLDAERRARGHRYTEHVADEALSPVELDPGAALVFTPLHLHGARVNRTAGTRVSVDLRFLPAAYADGFRWAAL